MRPPQVHVQRLGMGVFWPRVANLGFLGPEIGSFFVALLVVGAAVDVYCAYG